MTYPDGDYGEVTGDATCAEDEFGNPIADPGTSFAGPQVASAAALLKHRAVDLGWTWIDLPGRLHTMMLSMGDRATFVAENGALIPGCVSGNRILCGTDRYFGLGRLELRQHFFNWMRVKTFTSTTSDHKEILFGGPVGQGADIVKCVMQQGEDMTGLRTNKDDISHIELLLTVRGPDSRGRCTVGEGQVYMSRADQSNDDKHMVTLLDSDVELDDKCIEMQLLNGHVSSAGSVTTYTFCEWDFELDY